MNERPARPDRIDLAHAKNFMLGRLEIRPSRREIVGYGRRDTLEPRVMRALVALAQANGEILSRDDLIESCWDGVIVGEDAINRCISQLRKAAEASGNAFSIETMPRVGYRLNVVDVPGETVARADGQPSTAPGQNAEPEVSEPATQETGSITPASTAGALIDDISPSVRCAEEKPVFNHDLLTDPADIRLVRKAFPTVCEFLDWPKLREAFLEHEGRANNAKKLSRRSGLTAVAIALTALWVVVLVPGLGRFLPQTFMARIMLVVAAILAVAVLIFGTRTLMVVARESWLDHRAATERLRQLHFQFLVRHARQIATPQGGMDSAAMRERDRALELLERDLTPGNTKPAIAIVDDSGCSRCWLVDRPAPVQPAVAHAAALDELFRAYARLRFQHQVNYATKKLAPRASAWPWHSQGEARGLRTAAYALILIIVVCELWVLFLLTSGNTEVGTRGEAAQAVATVAALAALALVIAGGGIQPRSELVRLRNYRGEVLEIFRRFEAAAEPAEKLSLMERMEETSYRELRDFLTFHCGERFVL